MIFDNKGKTIDRYTLITKDKSIFGFNEDPFSPQGVGQYCGEWEGGLTKEETRHLGKRIAPQKLSGQARIYVDMILQANS